MENKLSTQTLTVPGRTLRLFSHEDPLAVGAVEHRDFLILRVLAAGDREDLTWLFGALDRAEQPAQILAVARRQQAQDQEAAMLRGCHRLGLLVGKQTQSAFGNREPTRGQSIPSGAVHARTNR